MKRAALLILLIPAAIAAVVVGTASRDSGFGRAPESIEVTRGPLTAWTVYEGRIESKSVEIIQSGFDGSATLTSLAPEGILVEPGTLLVTLDESEIERSIRSLERDVAVAEAEADGLANATHLLETRRLDLDVKSAEAEVSDEKQFLEDNRELVEEGLLSEFDINQQQLRLEKAILKYESLVMERELTTNIVHRTELERASAKLESARQELQVANRQLKNCRVRSPTSGSVVYLPLHVGGEYRTVRVGDKIFKNQPFISVPDMSEGVARCFVPEAELSRVEINDRALVVPLAYPDTAIDGIVSSIGSIARTQAGRPQWQKFFEVTIQLLKPDPRLRYGMTAECRIISHQAENALRVPRNAVWWEGSRAYCSVVENRRVQVRPIRVGGADHEFVEVLEGLNPGDRIKAQ